MRLSSLIGIICNYASYIKPDDDVVTSAVAAASLNEFAEVILGGTAVIPIAFAFMGPDGIKGGVGLSFIALPNVFREMGGGQIFGAMWFLLLFFAGFTSAIAMYNYLVALLEENLGFAKSKAAWAIFFLYILVGLPVGLEPILTKTADLAYFTEIDNWIGTYLLVVLGFIEVVVAGFMMGDKAFDEINRGGYWKVPKWFFNLFNRAITPAVLAILLVFSTIDFYKAGYFKAVPSFVENSPALVPWVQAARVVIFIVFAIGFYASYSSIKKTYSKELDENKVLIRIE